MTALTCTRCPRNCQVNRWDGQAGHCGVSGKDIYIARASLHMWEEPCISGDTGSGTVFFFGCPLRCIYCQNYRIAHVDPAGVEERSRIGGYEESRKVITRIEPMKTNANKDYEHIESQDDYNTSTPIINKPTKVNVHQLADIFLRLQDQGANNINLVTPTHYTPEITQAVLLAKEQGLSLPIVYNCSGYEKVETLRTLEGIVDIYLTDFKYMESGLAKQYSKAEDYPEVAKEALREMVRQMKARGDITASLNEKGMMQTGIIVRHLLLPNHVRNAKAVVKYVFEAYGDQVYISLMNQYTPLPQVADIPDLNRRVTRREYESLIDYAVSLGVEQGFVQEGETAMESFIPDF